jgi:hypothetical protein
MRTLWRMMHQVLHSMSFQSIQRIIRKWTVRTLNYGSSSHWRPSSSILLLEFYNRLSKSFSDLREAPVPEIQDNLSQSTPCLRTNSSYLSHNAYTSQQHTFTASDLSLSTTFNANVQHVGFSPQISPTGSFYTTSSPSSPISGKPVPTRHPFSNNDSFIRECYPHPDQEGLRQILELILSQPWWYHNKFEPDHALDVLIWKDEQGTLNCTICLRRYTRADRAIGHIRKHLDHRPYVCNGEKCRTLRW